MSDGALSSASPEARIADRDAAPPEEVRIADCDDTPSEVVRADCGRASAEPRPEALYVVSDGAGYVGTFPSAAAAEAATQPHPLVPFLVQRFEVAPGPADPVWVVLYRDLDAVAFVSNDRAEAARVQRTYAAVGLTYPDEIDYWEQPLGVVAAGASARLAARACSAGAATEADLCAAEEADAARVEALCAPRADGPFARAVRENARITILDAVVPYPLGPAPGAENL